MTQVCKAARNLVKESIILQFKIECLLAGVVENPFHTGGTTKQLLDRVHAWRDAWRMLKWTEHSKLSVGFPKAPLPDNQDWWTRQQTIKEQWSIHGSSMCLLLEGQRGIVFYRLPSRLRGISAKTWRMDDAGFVIHGFAHDYSQDLLVLVEHRLVQALSVNYGAHERDLGLWTPLSWFIFSQ